MHDGILTILIYKTHYDRLSPAIKENCIPSINPPHLVRYQVPETGRESAVK